MKLKDLLYGVQVLEYTGNRKNPDILNVACSTDKLTEKSLFVCIKGSKTDSHDLAEQAVASGAIVFVVERKIKTDKPQVVVQNSRVAMSLIAANFYGNPANFLQIISITGTNGKTTTSHIIASILRFAGKKVGLIGTSGIFTEDEKKISKLTTPDPIDLHAAFATMKEAGCEYAVMEASAHAIYYDKLEGLIADVGVFTNLTQDHLDFFGTMENYADAKRKFFSSKYMKRAVVNSDCPIGMRIAMEADVPVFTYGFNNPADVFCVNYAVNENGISFLMNLMDKLHDIKSKLFGRFNMYNILASATACSLVGIPLETIAQGIENMSEPAGRHNVVNCGKFKAVIDYAHTPDGIKNILAGIREYCRGKIITVFGCGGDRDKAKRPLMGYTAGANSDFCVLTSDNPRNENPEEIAKQAEEGLKSAQAPYRIILDRKEAIEFALGTAEKGDIVAILGKGDETTQEIKGIFHSFDDLEIVKSYMNNLKH